ncbi:MAG: NitT/TauT family transport system substrate-binding protein, partial [Bradyrhizobium sp.]|nr:NitT/TauT family transport system substrate-binding protein [Bradyrhizobium sp.]
MYKKCRLAVLAFGLALSASSAFAEDVTKIRFTLDWKIQGIHSWFYWAEDKGYFAAEKL